MSYLFPKRRLDDADVLDPVELNEDTVPAAEGYSGRLNAHNFDEDGTYTRGEETYITPHYVTVESDPDFGDAASGWKLPSTTDANAFTMKTDLEWQTVSSLTQTITTAQAVLWITGWLQYIWHEWSSATPGEHISDNGLVRGKLPARIQFAVRIDGRIIEWTVTGKRDPFEKSIIPNRWSNEKEVYSSDNDLYIPGPGVYRVSTAATLGPPVMPIRIGCAIPVNPGSHTVEIVCRRLGTELYRPALLEADTALSDYVTIYSRRLLILEVKSYPQMVGTGASVDVTTFAQEEPVGASTLGTDRVDKVRDAYNDIESGALARGALNHNHLPSATLDWAQREFIPEDQRTNNYYPGFTDTTDITDVAMNATGWLCLHNGSTTGATHLLRTDATHPDAFYTSVEKNFVIVKANVRFRRLYRPGDSHDDSSAFGAFALGWQRTGYSPQIIKETICFVNHHANYSEFKSSAEGGIYENIDIPLFYCMDNTAAATSVDVDWFGVFTSTIGDPSNSTIQHEIWWNEGYISVLLLPA